ncbi:MULTISPECIES: acyltransferase family protein [Chryseobacterium]|uniref:Peptidoglycan/LPS O-acetylase OafA/YrhL n=1 Tax=Chryseobacterium camelliae TaxID=1265445 RepID=A0ABU0TLI1_9FLAO|nr:MULTISPECIES: acyltransferase [Chryseobacterium]MDT3408238.1 peptidoglycan/LPS O-acetylase OafA/YrhL [Pseudacidovorax intermedius]MDQ1097905.1 peptidoglycan/LPS O-acetylase OafA/YrhL [Chryseobacterium camelliae]MDQ1101839.1 peptidoglycan/LPS O-acetylase OafA/YrhL [Chryseobacterium sp. SORGH_AS_1048]MDR6085279.1 peptidoglycan/LPS O-acetylase OafA/YrhL [Chryseobacterium sp. SORGH_AS_0909]MDR6129636.1 peptidoglycan/LPS O-acetylase OafA/YrhL [Chryseobacterium sp. SORGH_AS_1175]
MPDKRKRIEVLDGLRGLAIVLVFLFHGYYIWDAYYPFGKLYAGNVLFKYGSLGVQLFFLISGFVILMSVEKTPGFWTFIKNRWIRLFPSMLICSLIIYLTGGFFYERPFGIPELKSLLPGITFINNSILERLFGTSFPVLELSFWSLYVEVKFYFIFGALYFLFNRATALAGIFILYLSASVLQILIVYHAFTETATMKIYIGSFIHFGWFVAGALTYIYYQGREKKYLYLLIITILCSLFYAYKFQDAVLYVYLIILVLIFLGALFWAPFGVLFSGRVFKTIGFISYPLYLLHENMLIASVIKVHKFFPQIPYFLLPVIAFLFIGSLAYGVARFLEPALQRVLKKII